MNKSDLIADVAHRAELTNTAAERVVDTVLDTVAATLGRGEAVAIRSFGAWAVRTRPARTGRNPRTGKAIKVPTARLARFKPSRGLHDQLNGGGG